MFRKSLLPNELPGDTIRKLFLRYGLLSFCLGSILIGVNSQLMAAPQAADSLSELRGELREAGQFYRNGQFRKAAESVQQVQLGFEKLPPEAQKDRRRYAALAEALRKARALLELEGLSIRVAKPAEASKPVEQPAAKQTVSYADDVYPILKKRCGDCHVDDRQGGFSMADYALLMRGGKSGTAVFRKNGSKSPIVERIVAGEMPPDGPPLPAAELQTLIAWIDQGAPLDRKPDPEPTNQAIMTNRDLPAADGEVSFAQHIAPLFAEQCVSCHGNNNPRNDLSLATYARMQRGGDAGPLWEAGQPNASLLVRKLKGLGDGQRMPLNRPPLSDAQIAMVERWIQAGATFDGDAPNQPIQDLATAMRLKTASAEELSEERQALAQKSWGLVFAGQEPELHASDHFLLVGNDGQERLAEVARDAEALFAKVGKVFPLRSDSQAVKGRLSLFLLPDSYDYHEFAQMVEQRSIPPDWTGHWATPGLDAYLVTLRPRNADDRERFETDLCRSLVGTQVELSGAFPKWFVDGTVEVIHDRVFKRSRRGRDANQLLTEAFAAVTKPKQVMDGSLPPSQAKLLRADFVQNLFRKTGAFQAVIEEVSAGADFKESVEKQYGKPPEALMAQWLASKKRGR